MCIAHRDVAPLWAYTIVYMRMRTSITNIVLSTTLMLCLLGVTTYSALAQTATSSQATTTTVTTPVVTSVPAVAGQSLSPAEQKRIQNLAANISNRFDALIVRFGGITVRLESRALKMEQAGKDVTAARASLEKAHKALGLATTAMTTIDAEVAKVTSSQNPNAEWLAVHNTFIYTLGDMNTTKQMLRQAIAELKDAQETVRAATSTASSSPSN